VLNTPRQVFIPGSRRISGKRLALKQLILVVNGGPALALREGVEIAAGVTIAEVRADRV
jgi:hypothetical protein